MSLAATSWAWSVDGLDPGPKLVLLRLADHAGADGQCWPSLETIAERTGLHRTTVLRALTALEQAGHITRLRSRGGSSTRYLLAIGQVHHAPVVDPAPAPEQVHDAPVELSTAGAPRTCSPEPNRCVVLPQQVRGATSTGASRTPNRNEPSKNQPPSPPPSRIHQIAIRAGQLATNAKHPTPTDPTRYATTIANRLDRQQRPLLEHLATLDGHALDDLARAALAGQPPEPLAEPYVAQHDRYLTDDQRESGRRRIAELRAVIDHRQEATG